MLDNIKWVLIGIIIALVIIIGIILLYYQSIQQPGPQPQQFAPVDFDRPNYPLNSGGTITVLDASANTDSTVQETVTVRLTSPSDPSGFSFTLKERGKDSNVFLSPNFIEFRDPTILSVSFPSLALKVAAGEKVKAEYKGMTKEALVFDPNNMAGIGAFSNGQLVIHSAGGAFPTVGTPADLQLRLNCFDDLDEDGICDEWEQPDGLTITLPTGETYKLPCGTGDFDPDTGLAEDCPSPYKKDIFVEIDWMGAIPNDPLAGSHRPIQNAIDSVVNKFKIAPVSNPTGTPGIHLHIQIDQNGITNNYGSLVHDVTTPVPGMLSQPGALADNGFLNLKQANFGTQEDKNNAPNIGINPTNTAQWAAYMTAKRQAFHYAMFIHAQQGRVGSSGYGEIFGNDMVISLGSFANNGVGTAAEQAGTFMHELGHNLNLHHGGALPPDVGQPGIGAEDDTADNCKPNYLSVMSYSRQFPYLGSVDTLDYSNVALNPLNENGLTDSAGIGLQVPDITQYGIPDTANPSGRAIKSGPPTGTTSIDWDNDPSTSVGPANINNLGAQGCNSDTQITLNGFNDWSNLQFNFRGSSYFASGVSTDPDALNEITIEALQQLIANKYKIDPKSVYNSTTTHFSYMVSP